MREAEIKYYFSKPAIIFGLISFVFIGLLLIFFAYVLYLANLTIAMIACLLIFLLYIAMFLKFFKRVKLFQTDTPALILTKDQLIDNINRQNFKWSDIQNITAGSTIIKAVRVNYISISLIEPEKYITTLGGPYRKLIARLNNKYFGGAFSIQPNIIKCNNKELLNTLNKYQEENTR